MKKIFIAATVVAALMVGPALAADITPRPLPPAPPPVPYKVPVLIPTWTGFYVGGNVGGHWGTDKITTAADPVGWTACCGAGAANEINTRSAVSLKPKGVIGGIQAGFNWQVSTLVFGLEADADWVGGSASRTLIYTGAVFINPADVMTNSIKETFLATVRPRLGIAAGNALIYGTGGLAIGSLKATDTMCSFGCPAGVPADLATVSASSTRTGWTVGGGLEWRVVYNWSLKAEYLYVNLGTFSTNIPTCAAAACAVGADITVFHKYSDNIARVGLNYLFGAGPVVAGY